MADKKELNLEETEKISGGMPNPNSMTPEEWEQWVEKHKNDHQFGHHKVYAKNEDGILVEKEINVPVEVGATQN